MKRYILAITTVLILVSVSLLTGCVRVPIDNGNGASGTREYDFTDFNSVEVGYAMELEIIPADTYSITIKASEKILERIKVEKRGDTLEIGLDRLFFHFTQSPRIKITMPELRGLHLSGASHGEARGFKTDQDFVLTLSGASELDMDLETGDFKSSLSGASEAKGRLVAEDADFELSGASELTLAGSADSIRLDCTGSSEATMPDFTVDYADIDLSGASETDLTVNGKLDVNLSGASKLVCGGDYSLGSFDVSRSSELEHRDEN